MLFKGELVRFKSMRDAIRLEFDVPKIDAARVMGNIATFLEKELDINVSVAGGNITNVVKINAGQIKYINVMYAEIAQKFFMTAGFVKRRVKGSFLGDENQSITTLTTLQASAFIDRLNDLMKNGNLNETVL